MRKSVREALWRVWAAVMPATPAPRMATLVLRQCEGVGFAFEEEEGEEGEVIGFAVVRVRRERVVRR